MRARLALSALCALLLAGPAFATCGTDALLQVQVDARAATAPACGPRRIRRSFVHARNKVATVALRASRECARGAVPRLNGAHAALAKLQVKLVIVALDDACSATYLTALQQLVTALDDAATGPGTTTTSPPGASTTTTVPGTPTTTLPPACVTVQLEVDKGDCTAVTSVPARYVHCGADCDVQTFTVPGTGQLKLKGTPAPGDAGVTFDTDCADDGTVALDTATPPDCSLSCGCTSGL